MPLRRVLWFRSEAFFNANWFAISHLIEYLNFFIEQVETLQRECLESLLMFMRWNVAKGHEHRIAGVVMRAIEVSEFFVAQARNIFRFTTAVVVVSRRGE